MLPYVAGLANYLRKHRPLALLSGKTHTNLVAIWARRLAAVDTRVVISERTNLSKESGTSPRWRWRYVQPLVERVYPLADEITSVSDGVSDDLSAFARLPRHRVLTIYNPVVRPELYEMARQKPDHPWLEPGSPPVVLAVGRLTEQKQFPVLLDAFDRVRRGRDVRLLILGEGKERPALQARVEALDLGEHVEMPGFVDNPYAYMTHASLFVLSSAWEGLPGALIEALACGCPVVSTDCPDGPREILESGRYGPLVPVGNREALAQAMERVLGDPPDRAMLKRRGTDFAATTAIDRYLEVLTRRS